MGPMDLTAKRHVCAHWYFMTCEWSDCAKHPCLVTRVILKFWRSHGRCSMLYYSKLRRVSRDRTNFGTARAIQSGMDLSRFLLLTHWCTLNTLPSCHVTHGYGPIQLKTSRFELPKIPAHFIGE
ncbi:unnamed protein product [Penicillium olsonii]|uniref:Uncharacterized protein n=1 Tax=Penicillium olsonii TaxID=99116 RepID=A0A9W4N537_PENOL|nr:unnamed protein product [Penicillium olsonii]